MKKKLAIIASGGGMKCSYSVGSALALIDKYKLTNPEIAIGTSGGAGTMAYFVSGQRDSIRNIWGNLLTTKNFLNPRRFWKIMDVDYLIDQIFKIQDPLHIDNLYKSPTNFLVPCTNVVTGEVKYFSNHEPIDFFEVLRAAKAMPFAYGKTININGQKYCDTEISGWLTLHINKAKSLGAEKVLVLDNTNYDPFIENCFKLWELSRSEQFKKNYYSELKKANGVHFDDSVFFLRPKSELKISGFTSDKKLLNETIDLGYNDTIDNRELENFL